MSDLDARVAALMRCYLKRCRNGGMSQKQSDLIEFAVAEAETLGYFAELQKPALHEPVTDAEVASAIAVSCEPDLTTYGQGMRKALESFLQGRAKPAQEEITDELIRELAMKHFDHDWDFERSKAFYLDIVRASKGEKT